MQSATPWFPSSTERLYAQRIWVNNPLPSPGLKPSFPSMSLSSEALICLPSFQLRYAIVLITLISGFIIPRPLPFSPEEASLGYR